MGNGSTKITVGENLWKWVTTIPWIKTHGNNENKISYFYR